jgi:hypothetical protein
MHKELTVIIHIHTVEKGGQKVRTTAEQILDDIDDILMNKRGIIDGKVYVSTFRYLPERAKAFVA